MNKNYRNELTIAFRDNDRIEFKYKDKTAALNEIIRADKLDPIFNFFVYELKIDAHEFYVSLQILLNYIKD